MQKFIDCCHATIGKKRILGEIRSSAQQWLLHHPDASYEDFESAYGNPRNVAASYVEGLDSIDLLKKLSLRKRIFQVVFTMAAIILVLWLGIIAWAAIEAHQNNTSQLIENPVIEIESE